MADSTCAIGGKNPDGLEKITDGMRTAYHTAHTEQSQVNGLARQSDNLVGGSGP